MKYICDGMEYTYITGMGEIRNNYGVPVMSVKTEGKDIVVTRIKDNRVVCKIPSHDLILKSNDTESSRHYLIGRLAVEGFCRDVD